MFGRNALRLARPGGLRWIFYEPSYAFLGAVDRNGLLETLDLATSTAFAAPCLIALIAFFTLRDAIPEAFVCAWPCFFPPRSQRPT